LNYLVSAVESEENVLVNAAESSAKVSVDPRYGTWKKVSGVYEVVPPTGPALKDLVNSSAITPPTLPRG
jgi:hypothetical protein